MDSLLGGVDIDPVPALIGAVIVFVGIRLVVGAVRTAIRLAFVGVILIGAYLFLYGGNLTS